MIEKKMNHFSNLEDANYEANCIRQLANGLVKTSSLSETCLLIVKECKEALKADAICLLLIQNASDQEFEMVAQINCTEEFKKQWKRVKKDRFPLISANNPYEAFFIGSPTEVKKEISNIENLVDQSRRQIIAYAPLVVNGNSIGVLGFSYNSSKMARKVDKAFVITLVSLCAQGLERARLFEGEHRARKEAEEANKAKTDFLASMSHEIRTPIGVIKGFADLLYNSSSLSTTERRWALKILKNSEHLAALIGDILDISKIESQKLEANKCFFSLFDLIAGIKLVIIAKAEEKSIDLNFECSDVEVSVFSDPIYLRQIVINLVGNAIKFTPKFGKIEVRFDVEGTNLKILVTDNGVGIPAEHHTRIFEAFVRVQTPLKDRPAGTGLGLSISKSLATALGGNLRLVESKPNAGSTFALDVNCVTQPLFEQKVKPLKESEHKLEGVKILVVDDSEDNQELLRHVLSAEGGVVDLASNGLVGVKKALSADYNLVVMDIQMPEMDGTEAVAKLRAGGYKKPIIALTAEVVTGVRERLLDHGFNEYMSKPIDLKVFVETLTRFI